MDDLQIVELYFCRNEEAIKETDKKYGKLCFGISHNILKNMSDSEECVNDTYLTTWNTIPPTRPKSFKAFICGITRNISLKRLEYNTAMKRNPELIISLSEVEEMMANENFNTSMNDEELAGLINRFLRSIKADSRKVFIRRYYFFESISDISAQFGYSESKVKVMLYRTRNMLKEFLKKEGGIILRMVRLLWNSFFDEKAGKCLWNICLPHPSFLKDMESFMYSTV